MVSYRIVDWFHTGLLIGFIQGLLIGLKRPQDATFAPKVQINTGLLMGFIQDYCESLIGFKASAGRDICTEGANNYRIVDCLSYRIVESLSFDLSN